MIVFASCDQDEALEAEEILQEGLRSEPGLALANHVPYSPGRKVKEDCASPPSGYYVYITLRF